MTFRITTLLSFGLRRAMTRVRQEQEFRMPAPFQGWPRSTKANSQAPQPSLLNQPRRHFARSPKTPASENSTLLPPCLIRAAPHNKGMLNVRASSYGRTSDTVRALHPEKQYPRSG